MTVDEIYLHIGQSIVNAIDEADWTDVELNIEIVGFGVVGYTGSYNIGSQRRELAVRTIPREIRNWIRELHEITTQGGNNKWNRAIFTMNPDGDFNMGFIWDQALQDEVERLSRS